MQFYAFCCLPASSIVNSKLIRSACRRMWSCLGCSWILASQVHRLERKQNVLYIISSTGSMTPGRSERPDRQKQFLMARWMMVIVDGAVTRMVPWIFG